MTWSEPVRASLGRAALQRASKAGQAPYARYRTVALIDCDIHIEIGDPDEFLEFVQPAQRDWFRAQGLPMLGIPGYPWVHPTGWLRRSDLRRDNPAGRAGGTVDDVRREVLDLYDVDVGIATADDAVQVSLMPSPYRASALAQAHNDWMRERWLDHEPRLRGSIIVPAQDPQAARREILRCAADERFVQVLLCGGAPRPYGDPTYLPILETAAECGLVVTVHSGGEGMGLAAPPGGGGYPNFYIEWHTLGSACSIMAHLVSLICNGVFERLPDLRVMLVEGGIAWLPGIMWRLETNWRGLRAEIPWLERSPIEVLKAQIRFSTQPMEYTAGHDDALVSSLDAVGGADILCFATDYPHWDADTPATVLRRLPKSWRERVAHANAAAAYGSRLGLMPA